MIQDLLRDIAREEVLHQNTCDAANAIRKAIDAKHVLVHNWINEENLAHGAYVSIEDRIYRVVHHKAFGDLHGLDAIALSLIVKTLKAE